jgi:hypothetical protein
LNFHTFDPDILESFQQRPPGYTPIPGNDIYPGESSPFNKIVPPIRMVHTIERYQVAIQFCSQFHAIVAKLLE